MVKNKVFALCFRAAAVVLTVLSLMSIIGVFDGKFSWHSFLFYTIQSNVLVLAVFIFLTVSMARALKDAKKTDACFVPRVCAGALLCIMLTMLVFWIMLAPQYENPAELLKFSNNGVHLLVPLLMLADYVMFSVGGKIKRRDPLYFSAVPLFYLVFSTVAGLVGATYITGDGATRRFPYFFMDYDNTGWMCAVYIAVLAAAYIGFGFLLYLIDTRRKKHPVTQ
jgi:hypothetical protein